MISLDSIDPDLHNANRDDQDAYEKAMGAILNAQKADLDVVLQHVITHQNCQTENTIKLAQFAQKNGFSLDIIVAKALGEWEGKHEVLIDREDAKFLRKLHAQYPAARRDIFPSYGREGGCGVFKKCFHITQYGDVLICVFIHISLGNVFEDTLKTIVERGMTIKPLTKFSAICRAGEDKDFIERYMARFYGKPLPVLYTEIFDNEDILPTE
jgi:MoaA/NifB/PqqE/SkfB family radical SAM enzyme